MGAVQLDCMNTKDFSPADAVPLEILVDGGVPSTWDSTGIRAPSKIAQKLTREKSIKMDSNPSITIRPITASVAENPHV
jgi:hypothetical protein